MNDTPKDREPVRRVPAEPPQPYVTNVTTTPKRDVFPYVLGALIAATLVGLGVIILLLGRPTSSTVAPVPTPIANFPTEVPTAASDVVPTAQPTNGAGSSTDLSTPTLPSGAPPVQTVQPTVPAGATEQDVPRISMDEFKALYDDPARRPVIIDVRSKQNYDTGHIKGSVSFPEEEMATLVASLPKDKLVVAYCA